MYLSQLNQSLNHFQKPVEVNWFVEVGLCSRLKRQAVVALVSRGGTEYASQSRPSNT